MSIKLKAALIAILFIVFYPSDMDALSGAIDYIDFRLSANAEEKAVIKNKNIVMIDSDYDSVRDDIEIENGTDPHDPESY